jgi:hypothetical protein
VASKPMRTLSDSPATQTLIDLPPTEAFQSAVVNVSSSRLKGKVNLEVIQSFPSLTIEKLMLWMLPF